MSKDEVAAALDEIGTLLALQGENDFRTRAYHAAARALSQLHGDLSTAIADGTLAQTRGIGDATFKKIKTLHETGKLKYLEDLRAAIPAGVLELLRIPGLGPKKIKVLWDELGIVSADRLKAACESGQVATLKGFGDKMQSKILDGLRFLGEAGQRVRLDHAFLLGHTLLRQLQALDQVERAELCGSLRRRRETAKDIDLVASSTQPELVMEAFIHFPQVQQVVNHGPTKSSIVASLKLESGRPVTMNADLRVVTAKQFPYATLYLTGSKEHGIRLRQRALDRKFSLNEYDLAGAKPCKSEAEIYAALDLPYIEPELREDTGEIEAGEKGELPKLVEYKEIRGVFHNHTTESDGTATLEEMAKAAKKLGFEYFGVGDHSQSLTIANGLTPDRVRKQWAEIDALNAKLKGIRILKGTECDILADGSLDFPDELLAGFDYVVASVHSLFGLSEEDQTRRVCKALTHPAVTWLGHPTGRLLLRRDGYKLDVEAVLKTAAKYGKMIEINAQPDRLDLDWTHVKRAKALGIPLVINPDAHATDELAFTAFGVNVARRGWLTAADVFNTRPLREVLQELERRKKAAGE